MATDSLSQSPLKRCSKKDQCVHPENQDGWLPANTEYFSPDKAMRLGLCSQCRCCVRMINRDSCRRYRSKNPNKVRAQNEKWAREHPQQKRDYFKRWQKEHLEYFAVKSRNRRASEFDAEGTHTVADIEAQFKRQKGKCYYCGCRMTKKPYLPNSATVDHVVPLTRGGRNSPDNLVIACQTCNLKKHNKLPHEWTEGGRLL